MSENASVNLLFFSVLTFLPRWNCALNVSKMANNIFSFNKPANLIQETRYFATITAQLWDACTNTCSAFLAHAAAVGDLPDRFISAPQCRRGAPPTARGRSRK